MGLRSEQGGIAGGERGRSGDRRAQRTRLRWRRGAKPARGRCWRLARRLPQHANVPSRGRFRSPVCACGRMQPRTCPASTAPGHDLTVDDVGAHVRGVHAQDGALRRVDDGGGQHAAKHAAVAAGKRRGGMGRAAGWEERCPGAGHRLTVPPAIRPTCPTTPSDGDKPGQARKPQHRLHLMVKVPPAISSMDRVPSRALRPNSLIFCRRHADGWRAGRTTKGRESFSGLHRPLKALCCKVHREGGLIGRAIAGTRRRLANGWGI